MQRSSTPHAPGLRRALLARYAAPDLDTRLVRLRRDLGANVVARMFERASALGRRFAKDADPARHGVEVLSDIAYLRSGLTAHDLDVYRPLERDRPLPLVLYVHGGAFRSLSKDTHWIMGLAFARRGFVVANVNYRLAPEHRFPAGLEDVAEAFRFAVDHAAEWGADPSQVIFAGESAGANLVTALALAIGYDHDEPCARVARSVGLTPKAVLAACGAFQVSDGERFQRKHGLGWFFDDRYRELAENYLPLKGGVPTSHDLADPLCLVEREAPVRPLPPFFLPVGELDHLKDDHARMETALKRWGVDVEAPVYPKGLHAFHAFVPWETAKRCWRDHFEFLRRRGVPVWQTPDY
ncbi:MAG: alpha/beta hydrolase [Deltaproteobacteria bacterium]|nr:alpha/beta hydrolase [Deltaproteobacteria bacterium]